jgi:hypothetical protein
MATNQLGKRARQDDNSAIANEDNNEKEPAAKRVKHVFHIIS